MSSNTAKNSRRKKSSKQSSAQFIRLRKQLFRRRSLVILLGAAVILAGFYYQRYNDHRLPAPLPPPPANALYKQANQPIDKRVDDLLQRMTIEEKIGQMAMVDKNSVVKPVDVSRYGLGAVLSGAGAKPADNTPAGWLTMVETLKTQATQSRLGIPLLYGIDATHGHANVPGATVFPHDIGLGASADSDLVRQVGAATAEELAATGINWNFAPMLDAPQDIRWGRTYETFSSDPQLNAQLGTAYIEGTQKPVDATSRPLVLATAKHFLGVGSMKWLATNNKNFKIDQGKTPQRDDLLDSEYLVPFAAATKANVGSVMIGLTDYDKGRIIDNKYLITDKLKNELGFTGIVVSDWYGAYEFSGTSKYNANVTTINAGLDMAMLPYEYKDFVADVRKAVKKGAIPQSRIDDAVRRILYQKFSSGLFDEVSPQVPLTSIGSMQHRQLARKAVAESAVLLKNNNKVLPLAKDSGHILVAGTGADNIGRQCGAWTVEWQGIDGNWLPGATSILQGIRRAVGASSAIDYDKEANFDNLSGKADIGIAVISEKPYAEGWGDNPRPTLEQADLLAIQRLKTMAKKVVIVSVTGRPIFMNDQIAAADAMVAVWLPGSEGDGVADVLFGSQPFTGTLPVAWPATIKQVPISSNGITADGTPPLFTRGFKL